MTESLSKTIEILAAMSQTIFVENSFKTDSCKILSSLERSQTFLKVTLELFKAGLKPDDKKNLDIVLGKVIDDLGATKKLVEDEEPVGDLKEKPLITKMNKKCNNCGKEDCSGIRPESPNAESDDAPISDSNKKKTKGGGSKYESDTGSNFGIPTPTGSMKPIVKNKNDEKD